jgi:hypothetical protein
MEVEEERHGEARLSWSGNSRGNGGFEPPGLVIEQETLTSNISRP